MIYLARKFVNDIKIIKKSKILISGGESTVKIKEKAKEDVIKSLHYILLNMLKNIYQNLKFTMLSAGTDGRDGPTNAAGAIVNDNSLSLINDKKIDLEKMN